MRVATMNELEKAVIEAARKAVHEYFAGTLQGTQLAQAVEAWEKAQDPEVQEVGWHEVCEGDRLKSMKTGLFYEVEYVITLRDGKSRQIKLADIEKRITRPTEAEPTAFVKRGAAGKAVDIFVDVFSSGEAK